MSTTLPRSQDERRLYLIRTLLNEDPQYQSTQIPASPTQQFDLLRALFNVREPRPVSDEFLLVQDAYLSQLNQERGFTDADALTHVNTHDRLFLWQGDITRLKCGAIVNAANSALLGCFAPRHNCIDNMIHTYAGVQLRLKCHELMQAQGHEEPVGCAKITPAYNLPSQFVLHTVGPAIPPHHPLTQNDREQLASCYNSCLQLAKDNNIDSVAFCCISTGVFNFPNDIAAHIAVDTVTQFLKTDSSIKRVIFNVFKDDDLAIYKKLIDD